MYKGWDRIFDKGKCILVAEEKHGTRYFDAATKEILCKSALKLLKERYDQDYWYGPGKKPERPSDLPSNDDIKNMPDGILKKTAISMLKRYNSELQYFLQEEEFFENVKKAVDNEDGELAWECLYDHRDGEYQGVKLELLED
jgi:hypothetical protein